MKRLRAYLILTAWLLVTLAELAFAEQVKFAWDDIPMPHTRIQTHLFIVGENGSRTFLAEAPGMATTLTVEMLPGIYQVVAASEWRPGDWGLFSDPVTVVVEFPAWELNGSILTIARPCVINVTPQFSADLKKWEEHDSPETPFTLIKVETLKP